MSERSCCTPYTDMDEQRCVDATSAPAIAGSTSVAADRVVQDDRLYIKEERGDTDMDIGPTVLQHVDRHYSTKPTDASVVKHESTINCTFVVKEETSEDECRDAQHSEEPQHNQRAKSRLYRCVKCLHTFKRYNSLRMHCSRVHATGSHECNECNLKYKCKEYLAYHIRNVHIKQQCECTGCKKMCKSKEALRHHVQWCRELRPAGSRRQFTCNNCGKNFKTKWYWKKHEKSCNCTCPTASNMSAVAKQELDSHCSLTTGNRRQFTCSNCGNNFKTKWTCQRHENNCKFTRPNASNTSAVASTSTQQHSVVFVKEEPADGELDLGPVVLQHMDYNYRPYKQEPQLD